MSSAAPGIDHAIMTGCRLTQLMMAQHTPDPMDMAHTQDAVCRSSNPPARAASSTTSSGPE